MISYSYCLVTSSCCLTDSGLASLSMEADRLLFFLFVVTPDPSTADVAF